MIALVALCAVSLIALVLLGARALRLRSLSVAARAVAHAIVFAVCFASLLDLIDSHIAHVVALAALLFEEVAYLLLDMLRRRLFGHSL